ncbi:MAG: hypothetical protein HC905_18625, partial [Bacteroidales bacterium]|nr:hypothetical protein [Bacteroidales bacterium]
MQFPFHRETGQARQFLLHCVLFDKLLPISQAKCLIHCCLRYSKYSGKGDSFKYEGPYKDSKEMAAKRTFVAMDARDYSSTLKFNLST